MVQAAQIMRRQVRMEVVLGRIVLGLAQEEMGKKRHNRNRPRLAHFVFGASQPPPPRFASSDHCQPSWPSNLCLAANLIK